MVSLTVGLAVPGDKERWNKFVDDCDGGSVFHRYEWGEFLSEAYGYPLFYLLAKEDGNVVSVLPLMHVRSRLFGNRLVSVPFGDYGGPCSKNDQEGVSAVLERADEVMKDLGVEYIEIRAPDSRCVQVLERLGYGVQTSYCTLILDLRNPASEIWRGAEKRVRNAVRKAERSGVAVMEASDGRFVEEYYRVYLSNMKALGSPVHSLLFFKKMWDRLYRAGLMRIFLAEIGGEVVAGILLLLSGRTAHFWGSVSLKEFRAINPTNLLLWHAIRWGQESGYEKFDFGRTRRGSRVYLFKSAWRGREIPLPHFYIPSDRSSRSTPDPEKSRFKLLSRVWKLFPTPLTTALGPRIVKGIAL